MLRAFLRWIMGAVTGTHFTSEFSSEFVGGGVVYPVWNSLPATTALNATITGLTPGTTYDVRVCAVNAAFPNTPASSVAITIPTI